MNANVMQQMDEAVDRVTALLQRKDVVWQTQAAMELRSEYPNAVQYEVKADDMSLLLISGTAKNGDRFASGVVTMTGSNGSPVVMNLPPYLVEPAVQIALQSILNRN